MLNNKYPRISKIIPVDGMFQEHSGYEGKVVYIPVCALVLFEEIEDGEIVQFSRYLSHQQLTHVEYHLPDARNINDDTWIADVHLNEISKKSWLNSNLHDMESDFIERVAQEINN